jgi:hypothetical protein
LSSTDWNTFNGKQAALSGTGFVKASGTTISYDNNSYVVANSAITGATKTKITYDSKGLVTAGADATTSDIAEGSNQYYTDARARGAISLTTTGTSGAATYNNTTGVLNVPQYSGSGGGYLTQNSSTLYPTLREKLLLGSSATTTAEADLHFVDSAQTNTLNHIWQTYNYGPLTAVP